MMDYNQLIYLGGCMVALGIAFIAVVAYGVGKLRGEKSADYDDGYTDGYADGVTDGLEHGIMTSRR